MRVLPPATSAPPHDLEAETSVLGAILLDPAAIARVIDLIGPEDFYSPNNGQMFRAARNLHRKGEPIDNVTLAAELGKLGILDQVGGRAHLALLQEEVPTAANVETYAGIVKKQAGRRQRKDLAADLDAMADDPEMELADIDRRLTEFIAALPGPAEDGLADLRPAPSFPLHVLPGPARAHVERLAATGLPLDFLACAALGALAGALGAGPVIEVSETWRERAIAWFGLIGAKGTGKTPAIVAMAAPLHIVQKALSEDYKLRRQEWSELPGAERRREPKPVPQDLVIGDTTVEALARHMDRQPATILVADELRGLLASLGQYKSGRGSDLDRFLELWSGLPWSYKRATDDLSIYIAEPTLVIVGGIQPSRVAALGDGDDGLRARWLLVSAQQPGGDLESPFDARLGASGEGWAALVLALYEARSARRDWRCNADSRALWEAARKRFRAPAAEEPDHVSELLLKADRYALRLALLLAESHRAAAVAAGDRGQIALPGVVTGDVMAMAIELVEYFAGHRRAMRLIGTNLMARPAERDRDRAVEALGDWLEGRPEKRSTRRDVQRAHVAGVRTAEEVDALIARYGQSYPARVYQEPAPSGPARTVVVAPSAQRGHRSDAARQEGDGSSDRRGTVATVATVARTKPINAQKQGHPARMASSDEPSQLVSDSSLGDSGDGGDSPGHAPTGRPGHDAPERSVSVEEGSL